MASTAALQVQGHVAGGLQRRQAGTAFADLLSAMEALLEACLAEKSFVFIRVNLVASLFLVGRAHWFAWTRQKKKKKRMAVHSALVSRPSPGPELVSYHALCSC